MNKPKISVIVPVYNAEKYLDKCIESIVNQTYQNLEIVLVDDGSFDNSPQICDSWSQKDSRIVVIHKQNGGVSSARNAGLDVATGDYIGFVDSDDYIFECMYEKLLDSCIESRSDMSVCGFVHKDVQKCFDECSVYDTHQAIAMMFDRSVSAFEGYTCNKLYKASIINDNSIRFDCNAKLCEDTKINYQYLLCANKVSVIDYCGYYYFDNCDSACNNFSVRLDDSIFDVTSFFMQNIGREKDYYDIVLNWCLQHWLGLINVVLLNGLDKKMADKAVAMIRKNRVNIFFSKSVSMANKIQVAVLSVNKNLYCKMRKTRG